MTGAAAFVRNDRLDILGGNQLGYALYSEMFAGPVRPVNTARFVFLDPRARDFFVHWERAARDTVAVLRSAAGRDPHDRALSDLVGELSTQSERVPHHWASHNVRFHLNGDKHYHHPVVGRDQLQLRAPDARRRRGLTDLHLHRRARHARRGGAPAARQLGGHARTRPAHPGRPDMHHRPLGRTGVSVSQLCLGAMMFGAWGNPDHDESIRIIHAALDAGINFVDTADVYGARRVRGDRRQGAASGRRDDVVLATKFHNPMGEDPNRRGNSRRWIIRAVEDSLRRLDTDWIDLYQVHRPDPDTDIEETLSALTDLVHQGKVRYIGHSTFPASQIVEAQWVARDRRLQRFVTEQPAYSILVRGIEDDVLPTCPRHGMGVLSYSPLDRRLALRPLAQGHRAAVLLARRAGCPSASTSPSPPTSASSTPSRRSRSWPTRPASR